MAQSGPLGRVFGPVADYVASRSVTKDGRRSAPFPFPLDGQDWGPNSHIAPEIDAAFRSCFGETCGHYNEKGAACHTGCAALAERLGLTPAEYLPVTDYSYEPSKSDERRRRELVRFRLQQALKRNLGKLPTEVWDFVAKDLVHEYATLAISIIEPTTVFTINPSEAVWARYIDIDGVEYLKTVSHERHAGARLLWDKPNCPTGHVLYVAEDHLGIRQITNSPELTKPAESKAYSTWWRTVPGVKLRTFSATPLLPEIMWPYPMTPDEMNGMSLYYTMLDRDAKMLPVDINAPDTVGYSIGWRYGCAYLHVHRRGESLDFYHELDARQESEEVRSAAEPEIEIERRESRTTKAARMAEESDIQWMYHPLDAGEAINQVWIRQPQTLEGDDDDNSPYGPKYLWSDSPIDVAIGLVTNQGRTLVLGRPYDLPSKRFPWRCIAESSTASPMRIFFSQSLKGINLFAAPTSGASEEEPGPDSLYEAEPDSIVLFGNDLHTGASLEDVAEVVPCKATEEGNPRINGLLFRYKNGHERSVGRFRLDCTQPPLKFDDSSRLFLGIAGCESPTKKEHVGAVRLSAPEDPVGLKWKKIPAKEPIYWSWRECWSTVSYPSEEWRLFGGSDEDD
ncbi:hypothetical protein ACHAPT_012793 [Fusarium lateritium]